MSSTMSQPKLSRDEYKKQRELDELRKQGQAPAAVDADGNMINPHIPQFIADRPWYLQSAHTSNTGLKHQRIIHTPLLKLTGNDLSKSYKKGDATIKQPVSSADKYIPGSCVNCGSATHTAKQCLDRPRVMNAKRLGRKLGADEIKQSLQLTFDEKRDRWAGYDTNQYNEIVDKYERIEQQRKKYKTDDSNDNNANTSPSDSSDVDDIIHSDDQAAHTARNLRLREDTAKYLHNLNVNSAYYDPKSRSMRDNPFSNNDPRAQQFASDNFIKKTDDIKKLSDIESFVWDSTQHNNMNNTTIPVNDVHTQALPTVVEQMYQQYNIKKKQLDEQKKHDIDELYGTSTAAQPVPQHIKQLIEDELKQKQINQNDTDVNSGSAVADPTIRTKSIYDEDIYPGNHSSVWGSYYDLSSHTWGYACCHQMYKSSYCTSNQGIQAINNAQRRLQQQVDMSAVDNT